MDKHSIITARENILKRMNEFFLPCREVTGIFLEGSMASGIADEYSDIDYRVVIESESFDSFTRDHMTFLRQWGEFICNNGGRNLSVSHFKPFNKVDVFYYRPEDLAPSPWHRLPIIIIHDPRRLIHDIVKASQSLSFKPDQEEISNSISIGIGNAHEVYRRVQRHEFVYAQAILSSLRESIIEAKDAINECALQGRFGCSHFEHRCPNELKQIIMDSYTAANKKKILESLKALLGLYRMQVKTLHQKYNLDRNLQNDLYALDVVYAEI